MDLMDRPDPMDRPPGARCGKRARTTGEPCKRWPVAGARVCPSHGGKAPQVQRKARERLDFDWLIGVARARSPRDVMAEAVVIADALLSAAVQSGCLPAMADALERAARVARLALTTPPPVDALTPDTLDREIARLRDDLELHDQAAAQTLPDDLDARIARLHRELDES